MGSVKVRLFSQAEKNRRKRLNEAADIASVTADIQQIQFQINQADQDYQKRVQPLKKKLIELQAQLSNLQGSASQQAVQQTTNTQTSPQGGAAASPGAASAIQPGQ